MVRWRRRRSYEDGRDCTHSRIRKVVEVVGMEGRQTGEWYNKEARGIESCLRGKERYLSRT